MRIDLKGCARCHGEGHLGITFHPLTFPYIEDGGTEMTHWAPCPTNGEPILMGTTPLPEFGAGGGPGVAGSGVCSECRRDLHGYRGPLCRYCDPEADCE